MKKSNKIINKGDFSEIIVESKTYGDVVIKNGLYEVCFYNKGKRVFRKSSNSLEKAKEIKENYVNERKVNLSF